ncbi:GNAT family N-acetyltransferase [Vibrio ostreicida]|uniref:GNAT family N-acetyltransferase n=1 Tax=Vibrio ostreicida TaxID=526588 RepID=UPI003B598721
MKAFSTARLVIERYQNQPHHQDVIARVMGLLTQEVVVNLPANFHGIETMFAAEKWLDTMQSESTLFLIKQNVDETLIGFMFIYEEEQNAHLGYLFGEAYWGQGLASELLIGLVKTVHRENCWSKLVAGVERSNPASAKVLRKAGFHQQNEEQASVLFFEYTFEKAVQSTDEK